MDVTNFPSQSLRDAWVPRTDGIFLKDDPQKLVEHGSVAKVPFVAGAFLFLDMLTLNNLLVFPGCTDDEGTLFAISSQNLT